MHPDFHFSFSKPGFLTFKLPEDWSVQKKLTLTVPSLQTTFARCCVPFLGKVCARDFDFRQERMADWVWRLCRCDFLPESDRCPHKIRRIHVWEPDVASIHDRIAVGDDVRTFEPGLTPSAFELHQTLLNAAPEEFRQLFAKDVDQLDAQAQPGEICLDCVPVTKDDWWIGFHRVGEVHSRFPGGLLPLKMPPEACSRAWLKFEEGVRWSEFPIETGSRCLDIGASPGGGSQVLLQRGANVLGVDPAEMDPRVLEHPNFTHLRGRIGQLKRKLFRKTRWVLTDMNVAPSYTLGVLEELVCRPDIAVRGLLFTLKFFDWNMAENLPDYVKQIQSWGFNVVKTRQLVFNHQEIMVAALKKPFRK